MKTNEMDLKLFTYEQRRNFLIKKNEKTNHLIYETKFKVRIKLEQNKEKMKIFK